MVQYVGIHDPGNPQQTLPNFMSTGHITISQVVGRIRQECLEYAKSGKNEVQLKMIKELVLNSNVKPRERFSVSEGIAHWLKNQGVSVWR